MEMVLEAKGIKKVYGTRGNVFTAIQDMDLQIARGEFVGIMGPSGSGKSTLLNILSTIDTPSAGTVKINQQNILKMKESALAILRRDQLGFIFQDYNLLDTLTIKENISLPLALANVNPADIEERIKRVSEIFGIGRILDQYPHEISGGQQQRTATARAIITNPSLVFADEPTGALDSKSAYNLLQTLAKLNEQEKATILMVTHDAYAASFCSRVMFIKDGAIFTELRKGDQKREPFFHRIIDILTTLGGGGQHVVI
ncbi:ABC transporter ATP-binding protein [Bacillus sp. T33-2]|uniref:ABC transporter ATP-binding protein n=1 Tax=Bacillus sp. T33-2 TaxID=2054168 RepID=UPI000C759416|nr:ABC transporter ATP-binding protein [Bacillus sp. T33-2]PLR96759.1 bacitracin ABC transporter ATP-binding protein [Bacillus sp. T33-2]